MRQHVLIVRFFGLGLFALTWGIAVGDRPGGAADLQVETAAAGLASYGVSSGPDASPADDQAAAKDEAVAASPLHMSPGIVCRWIDGYEKYEPLPDATQTADEKLLVYVRVYGFKTEHADGQYRARLVPDFQIRRRGNKAVLFEKLRAFEYEPKAPQPLGNIYLKNIISVKGLPPGDYNLTIILHDELARGAPATQVVKFKLIPVAEASKKQAEEKASDEAD